MRLFSIIRVFLSESVSNNQLFLVLSIPSCAVWQLKPKFSLLLPDDSILKEPLDLSSDNWMNFDFPASLVQTSAFPMCQSCVLKWQITVISRQLVSLSDFHLPFPLGRTCYGSVSKMFVRCNCLLLPYGISTFLQLPERSAVGVPYFYFHSYRSGWFHS
jgi:hypothetical protein